MATGDTSPSEHVLKRTLAISSTADYELHRRDMVAAAVMQQRMQPASPLQVGDYRFAFQVLPANVLSGDFVCVVELMNGCTVFFVADVAGHGIASAMVTVAIKSFTTRLERVENISAQGSAAEPATAVNSSVEPAALLKALNGELLALDLQRHVCIVCGVIDASHVLTLAGAGAYPAPLLVRQQGTSLVDTAINLEGKALGLFPDPQCVQTRLTLGVSDRLTVVTDGVLELMDLNSSDEHLSLLGKAARCSEAEAFYNALAVSIPPDQPDDLTWFCVERIA